MFSLHEGGAVFSFMSEAKKMHVNRHLLKKSKESFYQHGDRLIFDLVGEGSEIEILPGAG